MTLLENPTPLELGLERADDTYGRLAPELVRITAIGRTDTPADWLPFVLENKGLEQIVPYVRDMAKALREGPYWLTKRGTDTAIEIGIGWVESAGTVAPADGRHPWYQFQVGYPEPPEGIEQIRQLAGIIGLSKSSWDELFRLYSPAHDWRPVRADMHRADEGGCYDGYSGTRRWEGGPLVSLGTDETSAVDLAPIVGTGVIAERWCEIDRADEGLRYDVSRFGDAAEPGCGSAGESDKTVFVRRADDTWPDVWPVEPWSQAAAGPLVWSGPYRRNDATAAAAYADDTWPDVHPRTSWREAAGGHPIPLAPESP